MAGKASRDLLISRADVWSCTDKGIVWLTDRYVLARADLFKNPPPASADLRVRTLRKLLAEVRAAEQLPGVASATDNVVEARDGKPVALVSSRTLLAAFNLRAWTTWQTLGLHPVLNVKGQSVWYGTVRGKRTLFGVINPVRLGGWPR